VLAFDLGYAADLEHGTEYRFALAELALTVAQQIFCRLSPGGGPSKLRH